MCLGEEGSEKQFLSTMIERFCDDRREKKIMQQKRNSGEKIDC